MQLKARPSQMKKCLINASLSIALVFVSGCSNQRILDQNGLTFVIGYDVYSKDLVRGTVVYPVVNPFATEKVQVISAVNHTSKGVRDIYDLQADKTPVSGQLRVALYNEKLARQGIMHLIDSLYRDPTVGTRVYLGVVEKECYGLLTKPFKEEGNIGNYMYELLNHNIKEEKIPSSTIHEFLRAYYSNGSDPLLPLITTKGDEVIIKGLALFHKDKMVGWITTREAFLVKLLINRFHNGDYQAAIPAEKLTPKAEKQSSNKAAKVFVMLDTLSSRSRIKVISTNPPRFFVKVNMNARVLEVSREVNLGDKKVVNTLNQEIAKEVERDFLVLTQKLQKLKVDPAGFGEHYQAASHQGKVMSRGDWYKLYPKANITYGVTVKLLRSGTVD